VLTGTSPIRGRRTARRREGSFPRLVQSLAPNDLAAIELVRPMPRDGSTGSFWFGKAAGIPQGVLAVLGVTAVSIPPSRRASRPARDLTRPLAERAHNRRHDRDEKCSDPCAVTLAREIARCGGAILPVRGNPAHSLRWGPAVTGERIKKSSTNYARRRPQN
jgi:hypothetical protein